MKMNKYSCSLIVYTVLITAFMNNGCQIVRKQMSLTSESMNIEPTSFQGDIIQLAWFHKPPDSGSLDILSNYFDVFILTNHDEVYRDKLRSLKRNSTIYQYLLLAEIQNPDSCSIHPFGNQVANQSGDFCRISQEHPDWFLLDQDGNYIMDERYYFMDPGNPGYRQFWLQRAQQVQEEMGWYAMYLDNAEASLGKLKRMGVKTLKYPEDASYQAAIEGFLAYLYENYFQPTQHPVIANIIEVADNNTWFRYMQHLDGAMIEAFAVDWQDGYMSSASWNEQLELISHTLDIGKSLILVAQGTKYDSDRQKYSFASYLLVNNGRASFRYSNDEYYGEPWIYDDYLIDIGLPLGPRFQEGKNWRRDFSNGYVLVDPEKHTASITINE